MKLYFIPIQLSHSLNVDRTMSSLGYNHSYQAFSILCKHK